MSSSYSYYDYFWQILCDKKNSAASLLRKILLLVFINFTCDFKNTFEKEIICFANLEIKKHNTYDG